jgi:hypothetical protein
MIPRVAACETKHRDYHVVFSLPRIPDAWYEDDTASNESWTAYSKVELEAVAKRLSELVHCEAEQATYIEERKADACARIQARPSSGFFGPF